MKKLICIYILMAVHLQGCRVDPDLNVKPTPDLHPIVGKWEWVKSIFLFGGYIYTPASTGTTWHYHFMPNDSVDKFINGLFVSRQRYEFRWVQHFVSPPDSILYLFIGDAGYIQYFQNDTLIITNEMTDGGRNYFIKNQ